MPQDNQSVVMLGRWICNTYYRDRGGLLNCIGVHGLESIFGDEVQKHFAWMELLAGAYRLPQLSRLRRVSYNPAGAKWERLGPEVGPDSVFFGVQSIDGFGKVRQGELELYEAVGNSAVKFFRNGAK